MLLGIIGATAVIAVLTKKKKTWLMSRRHIEKYKDKDSGGSASCPKNGIKLDNVEVYLINMDKNKERLANFVEQYMLSDLKYKQFNRMSAVDGKSLVIDEYVTQQALQEIKDLDRKGYRTKHYQLSRGAIGCYLSHLNVYKKVMQGDAEYALIFEDDAMLDSNIFSKLNKSLSTIPNDWDMLLLGCYCIVCDKYEKYYDLDRFFFMHAYIIKKSSAKLVFEELDKKRISQQIDSELSDMINNGKLRIYCLKDSIARQGTFDTTIQMPLKVMPGVDPFEAVH